MDHPQADEKLGGQILSLGAGVLGFALLVPGLFLLDRLLDGVTLVSAPLLLLIAGTLFSFLRRRAGRDVQKAYIVGLAVGVVWHVWLILTLTGVLPLEKRESYRPGAGVPLIHMWFERRELVPLAVARPSTSAGETLGWTALYAEPFGLERRLSPRLRHERHEHPREEA